VSPAGKKLEKGTTRGQGEVGERPRSEKRGPRKQGKSGGESANHDGQEPTRLQRKKRVSEAKQGRKMETVNAHRLTPRCSSRGVKVRTRIEGERVGNPKEGGGG